MMGMGSEMNNIYDYMDYREFLKDRIEYLRENNPKFSYRYFNKRAGFKSPSYIKQIIQGRVNLGIKGIKGILAGLNLSEREGRFFEAVVHFCQASEADEKEKYYAEMRKRYPAKHAKYIESKLYNIFTHWYYSVILEMVNLKGFKNDARWKSKRLKPSVSVMGVRKALKDLLETGLLVEDKKGCLRRSEKMIATPEGVESMSIIKYQQQFAGLACEAILKDEVKDKSTTTITVAVSEEMFDKMRNMMKEFRNEIRKMAEESDTGQKKIVSHANLQLFKLTR